MDPFNESGLRFTPPNGSCFRFADCAAYQRLAGRQVCEMDVGWWDESKQAICFVEVKDYATRPPAKELLPNLVAKGRDCLVMLHSVWGQLGDVARNLSLDLPEPCRTRQNLRMFFVLKVGPEGLSRESLGPMKERLSNHIKAYADLLGIQSLVVLLLDHETAIAKGLPVALIDSAP